MIESAPGCRICGEPTIRAHLTPRAFAEDIRAGDQDMKVGEKAKTGYKNSKTGFFDNNILCAEHDRKIGVFDDYAVTLCRSFEHKKRMINDHMFVLDDVDTDKLVEFAVSMCWRYSISRRPEADNIMLGPFEKSLRKLFLATGMFH